jgi:hypothetical protein
VLFSPKLSGFGANIGLDEQVSRRDALAIQL